MAKKATNGKKPGRADAGGPPGRNVQSAVSKGYTSPAWERVYLLAVELDAFATDLGLQPRDPDADGFDLADAARELTRLALNHNREANPEGRKPAQEKEDWVAVGGLGADLGNMADEGAVGGAADGVRAVAYELCYLACDYLF
ncbi:MAG TPA: hypothetical protein VKD90_06635 [Gemmataceae bacterium]|nr:hypothetical protein [Gemmataceae bacterium]